MNNWVDFLSDATAVKAIFGEDIPVLVGVDVHEIILHRDGPKASVRFDLAQYPVRPPKKWGAMRFNRVQVIIDAFDIKKLSIIGWEKRLVMDIEISQEEGGISFRAKGGEVKFEILAGFLDLSGISAYKDDEG
nr:Imm50 family immunity protein [Halomonas socia]